MSELAPVMHPPGDPIADIGMSVERTALSWQRTILALVVASVVAARYVSVMVGGVLPIILGVAGTGCGIVALIWTRRRYAEMSQALQAQGHLHRAGGAHLLLVALSMLCLTALVVLYVVVGD